MYKCTCPRCGGELQIELKASSALQLPTAMSRPSKSEYAVVRDTPRARPRPPEPVANKPKYQIDTDTGAFRQALFEASFVKGADGTIFNDKNVDSRRLKLWGGQINAHGTTTQLRRLDAALKKYFGDRLISHGTYGSSYVVRLTLQ